MEIAFYGSLGEQIGRRLDLDPPDAVATVAELRQWLAALYPNAKEALLSPRFRACIGDEIAGEDHVVTGCASVEFFPPLSGG